jgi:hypothetical protein
MLHVGLDLSRRMLDACLLSAAGEHLEVVAVRLKHVAARVLAAGSDRQVRVRGHDDGLDATSLKRSLKQAVEVRRYKNLDEAAGREVCEALVRRPRLDALEVFRQVAAARRLIRRDEFTDVGIADVGAPRLPQPRAQPLRVERLAGCSL